MISNDLRPRAGNTAVIIEFCGEKRQESCEQYLEESIYSTEQVEILFWNIFFQKKLQKKTIKKQIIQKRFILNKRS